MTRLRPFLAPLAAAATLGALAWGTGAAVADGTLGLEGGVAAPALSPGSTSSHVLTVTNGRPGPVELELRVEDVTGSENGCVRPELTVDGEECDDDGGELTRDVTVALSRDGVELWRGGLLDLREGALVDEAMPGGAEWELALDVGLALGSPNDTMTDQVGFTTVVEARDAVGEPEVAGVQTTLTGEEAPDGAAGDGAGTDGTTVPTAVDAGLRWEVPFTDGSVSLWPLLVNGGAAVLGAGAWWRLRRRQKVCSGPGNVPARTSSA